MAEDRDAAGVYTGPDEKTITLRKPVKRKGADDLVAVTLQEPTAKQLSTYLALRNNSQDDGVAAMVQLICNVSGNIQPDIEAMKQRDFDDCAAFLQVFTTVPPPKTSAS
jgi:hypothetical protein